MVRNKPQTTTFSWSEEAFILSSLKEVTQVWARGTGNATFNLNIVDGFANLQLGFSLGQPTDPHLHAEPGESHHLPAHHHPPKKRRKKGPARREKDCARAAQHHASLKSQAAAVSSCAQEQTETFKPSDIVLPVTGKLLLVRQKSKISAAASAASSLPPPPRASAAAASVATPPTGTPPPRTVLPMKTKVSTTAKRYLDVNCVKKHLFSSSPSHPQSSSAPLPFKLAYKRKEDELWSRLFS